MIEVSGKHFMSFEFCVFTVTQVTDQTVEEDAAARAAVSGQQDAVAVPAMAGV